MRTHGTRHPPRLAIATLAAAAALSLATPAARGDDRGLLHATQQNPYVFIILDTSGSMHQSISCTQADHDSDVVNGVVPPCAVCAPGDCLPRLMGDDPDSKISVAKQSIYAIMATHPNINFGFGHYDQTQLVVLYKYWYYDLVGTSPIKLLDGTTYPRSNPGEEHLFGQQAWSCTTGGFGGTTFNQVGCNAAHPAHLDNAWEYERVRRYPKLGDDNSKTFSYYFQETTGAPTAANPIYKVTFSPAPAQPALGAATYQAVVKVENCNVDPSCAAPAALTGGTQTLSFSLATLGGTVYWDTPVELNGTNVPDPGGNGGNFYGGNPWTAREVTANYSNTNHQLEPNTDVALDAWIGATGNCLSGQPLCDIEQLTTADPAGRKPANTFSIGDIIPLDWTSNQQTLIANRMAPDPTLGPIRMFGIAPYLKDHRVAGENALELNNTALRPLAPEGGTPTGNVMMSFANLMTGSNWPVSKFNANAASSGSSWIGTASGATGDPFFSCKTAYVLLLTDGLASSDDGDWTLDKSACPVYAAWNKITSPAPGFACCAAEALRTINYNASLPNLAFPIRTYVIGLGLTSTTVGGYNNTLQCIADEGGTGNRHFFNGNPNTVAGQPKGFPAADPPPPGFCCSAANNALPTTDPNYCAPVNPCDGPGPILPRNKSDVVTALQTVLNLIQSQTTAFASAAVPSIQSNVQNKSIITSFLPINQPIWPGRVDAFIDPVPTTLTTVTLPDGTTAQATVPDPTQQCTSPGQQGCHLWNTGDQILAQGIAGFDTAFTDSSKRRVFYAPATPVVPGEQRLFLQMPAVTDTGRLFDLENALGLCGPGYSFPAPVGPEGCTENSGPASSLCAAPTGNPLIMINPCPSPQTTSTAPFTTAAQAVTFAEALKSYRDPSTNTTKQYLLGDIFHSDPQVLGQPVNVTLFDGNLDGYQAFANAERFRRKVLYFGSNDGQLHAVDAGTVQQGTVAEHQTWVFNNGTGNEIFAFVPRTVMPSLNQLAALNASGGGGETFMVDGPPHLAEGFFDATGVTNPCPTSNPPAACQWHSLVIGGLREGGRGYYALDVTQPDTLTPEALFPDCTTPKTPPDPTCANNPTVQVPNPNAATYLPNCMATGNPPNLPATAGCGQLAYPMPLWEFTDNVKVNPACVTNCQLRPNDEDASGPGLTQPDLGQAWSRPNSGRVRICDNPPACDQFHEQWVVVFGGGMDPNAGNSQGNWLYMLDMATGKILYKRALNGSVPSEPAAVDTGQDGWIDTIYVGTTAGHLYKLDLTLAAPIDPKTTRVSTSSWIPFEIFDTEGRQMFYPPAVFFDTDLNQFGLAWGTGDRQDLWKCAGAVSTCVSTDPDRLSGRFYVILDRDTTTGFALTSKTSGLPFKAANLPALTPDGAAAGTKSFLLTPGNGMQPGWYLDLKSGERVLTEAFALSGILIFSSYVPAVVIPTNSNSVCADTGDTRVFVLKVNNGDAIGQVASLGTGTPGNGSGGVPTNRYFVLAKDLGLNVNTSESTPIIATKNNPNPVQPPALSDTIKKALQNVMANIKLLMPSNCRFSAKRINVTVTDTFNTQFPVAAVPECIIEKNWKEF